jgi:hypothetical protein
MTLVPNFVEDPLAPSPYPEKDTKSEWTKKSRRTGLLAVKIGMYNAYNNWGLFLPLTVLQVGVVVIVGHTLGSDSLFFFSFVHSLISTH